MQFGCFTQARLFQPSGTKNGRPNLKQAMRATSAVHRRCGGRAACFLYICLRQFFAVDINQLIQVIAAGALPVLFAITVHEAAHGYAARHFGDHTAAMMGRLTLNPLKHIDLFGTVLMPLLLYFATSGAFVFGYARPVPVIARNLRNPKTDMAWVALAGPASNFVMALLWAAMLLGLRAGSVMEPFLVLMAQIGMTTNVALLALNLFPLPPLDGGRVLAGTLPPQAALTLARVEPFGFFLVMGLILMDVLDWLWMRPIMGATYWLIEMLLSPFFR